MKNPVRKRRPWASRRAAKRPQPARGRRQVRRLRQALVKRPAKKRARSRAKKPGRKQVRRLKRVQDRSQARRPARRTNPVQLVNSTGERSTLALSGAFEFFTLHACSLKLEPCESALCSWRSSLALSPRAFPSG